MMDYPESPRCELIENLHGEMVADPYRLLEDLDSAETRQWIKAENQLTGEFISRINSKQAISGRLASLWDYDQYDTPVVRAGRYFFSRQSGQKNQPSLFWADSLTGEPKLLIDPALLSADGTVALSNYSISCDGRYLMYGLSESGSDWQEWRVREVATGRDLDDCLKWIKFAIASWTHDNVGFFYCCYDKPADGMSYKGPNYFQKLYYHRLGTAQEEDRLVYERPDHKDWGFSPEVSEDGRYLVISVWSGGSRNHAVYYADLTKEMTVTGPLPGEFEATYIYLGSRKSCLYFSTDHEASNSKIAAIDIAAPGKGSWVDIVHETTDALVDAVMADGRFIVSYLHDAYSRVEIVSLEGNKITDVALPGLGTVEQLSGRSCESEAFISYVDFTSPGSIYQLDLESGCLTQLWQPTVKFDGNNFITKQVFFTSRDGTRVPMFICYKKGLVVDGQREVHLYGYGGFSAAKTPAFSVNNLVWMEMGGIYALANLRGGGEYGQAWHQAGTKLNKQNVFDDFIAAGEWLISNGYTCTSKLTIGGRSNGGLLTGAVMTQRPELFGACLVEVGVLDMLRYHKFTIGWAWEPDYGSPENAEEFAALYAYSPYHNVKPGTEYPPTMITTGDHDDRVYPAHSFKFAAALQAAQAGDNPILIRVDTKAGHGHGKPKSKLIDEWADKLAFLASFSQMTEEWDF